MSGARILVVDDDPDLLHLITVRLSAVGHVVIEATSGEQGLIRFRKHRPQLVITDLRMGEMDGLALFDHLQADAPTIPVIILTAHGSIPDAVAATQRGVFSFLTKPFDGKELLRRVNDAIRISPVLDPTHELAQWRQDLLTVSVRMEDVLRQALRISEEDRSALIIGPKGSGKSTLVNAIHQAGKRSSGPFVAVACGGYPASELESALLPCAEGNFFARAKNGVLHLREIGVLSPLAQSRLFSFLLAQMQANDPFQRLSEASGQDRAPDVQVIASSPRPLETAVAEGGFRSDLFYLLGAATVEIPSLTERIEDIPILATHFLSRISPKNRITLTPDALLALQNARWPGNVTQLKNVLEQVASLTLTPSIPAALINRVVRDCDAENLSALDNARKEFERDYLVRLLQSTSGNVTQAARVAERNRTEFYKLLTRHDLNPTDFKQKSPLAKSSSAKKQNQ